MQVYNNVPAFGVWVNYTANISNLRQSMSKLSSGLKIMSAGDDPAGLAMSERLRAQYRNTAAAAGNVENKINYLQTADAWLQKVHDIIGRMAELSIMANDGTKSQTDRNNLQTEFAQMQKEIQRITSGATAAAKFNGLYLFRGGNGVAVMTSDGVQTGFGAVRLKSVRTATRCLTRIRLTSQRQTSP
jgi:flagellin